MMIPTARMKNAWPQMVSTLLLVILGLVCRNLRSTNLLKVSFRNSILNRADGAVASGLLDDFSCQGERHVLDNQTYIWYGNQWMPPPGVPMYTREDMKAAFSQFDTLWIGDSTTRRAYATIFALMNSTSTSVTIPELNDYRVIDVNKRYFQGKVDEDSCRRHREEANKLLELGSANIWTNASLCRRVGQRSFDYIRTECFKELSEISRLKEEIMRYTLVVVGMGLHDALKPGACALPVQTPHSSFVANMTQEGPFQDLERQLYTAWEAAIEIANTMEEAKGHHNATTTAVLWRTSGFHSKEQALVTGRALHLNQLSLELFGNESAVLSANGTMALVDWGRAIFPRSFPPNRIEGDMGPHYGLEARMLMAQMTTQQLLNVLEQTKVHHHLMTHSHGYS